ncbi:hypothetical protein ElyMa_000579100 [Elysia marginata]|uniref:Uncharacterized protein n=1 Tax=Elysia marginata TaxID=1093978 RepID=A0AAV4G4Y0_9GAST|nr:hypothetical protein ElyMa_000579100 [Elysia marginata]
MVEEDKDTREGHGKKEEEEGGEEKEKAVLKTIERRIRSSCVKISSTCVNTRCQAKIMQRTGSMEAAEMDLDDRWPRCAADVARGTLPVPADCYARC